MVWLVLCVIILPFGIVLLFGAPYLPTRRLKAKQALDLLNLRRGEILVDLGSGDGAVLIEGAKRGLICYGYELNPFVWLVSWVRTIRYRKNITVKLGNFWNKKLPLNTKAVFVFLLDPYMQKLDKKLQSELKPGGLVISYTFKIPQKKPIKEVDALYLYQY